MRRARRFVPAVVLAALVAVAAPTTSLPAAADPGFTATPTEGLLDRQPVAFSGSGLTPGSTVVVAFCGSAEVEHCAHDIYFDDHVLDVAENTPFTVGPDGTFSGGMRLHRSLAVDGTSFDCVAGGCTLGLIVGDDYVAGVPLTFAAEGTYQWPEAALAVTPSSGVVDGQRVSLSASGLDPYYAIPSHDALEVAFIEVCRAVADPGPDDCRHGFENMNAGISTFGFLQTDPDGTAEGHLDVPRDLDLPGGPVDCAVVGCTVALDQSRNPVSNRVPLEFGPEWAPYPSAPAFLAALGRVRGTAFTAQERADLTTALTARSIRGADALADAAVRGSTATGSTHHLAEVTRLYRAFFGRPADAGGLAYWADRMDRGLTGVEMARLFGGTAEFRRVYGAASNVQVVDRAYRNTLGRAGEPGGRTYWTGRLDQGLARWKMIYGFGRSTEFESREQMRTAITVMTWRLLGRVPGSYELLGLPSDDTYPAGGSVRNVARSVLASGDLP